MKGLRSLSRQKFWFIPLFVLLLCAGCCSTTSTGVSAPTVAAVTPGLSVSSVCTSTTVTATFNQPMNGSTLNGSSFTLAAPGGAPVSGQVAYDATTNMATFTSVAALAPSTLYTATLTTAVKDSYGTSLASAYVWTFTTGTTVCHPAPVVVSVTPLNTANGVCPNTTLSITFSEPMNASTLNASTFTVAPGVTGTITANASNTTFTFTPSAPLIAGTTYTATISTGAQDPFQNHLASPYSWSFSIAADGCHPPPTVSSVTPPNASTNVCPNKIVSATFDEPIAPATINAMTFTLAGPSGTPIAGTVTYSQSANTAIFTPSSSLTLNTTYTATLTTGVMDLFGNSLASNYVWTFTTGNNSCLPPPPPVSVTPSVSEVGVCSNAVITATFAQAMNPNTLNATTFIVAGPGGAPVIGQITHDPTSKIFTFAPSSTLAQSTAYTVTITTGVEDTFGNQLASNFVYRFTTGAAPCTPGPLPTVISVSPVAGAAGECQNSVLTATFNQPMNPATITSTTFTVAPNVTGTVSVDGTDTVATFTPSANLALNTVYTATITTGVQDANGNPLVGDFFWSFTSATLLCQPPVPLASAGNFELLAGNSVASNGGTVIGGGDLGVYPGSTVTGFPPATLLPPSIIDAGDAVAAQAENDLSFAYNYAAGLSGGAALPTELSGVTLTPGLYQIAGPVTLSSGQVTLDGQNQPNPVFIFQIGTSLTTFASTQVLMINGTQASNVFWQVGGSAGLGANSVFAGTILSLNGITLDATAAMQGRALTRGGTVTLDSNVLAAP